MAKEITLRPCKIFEGVRLHIGSCHNRYDSCWKRAMYKQDIKDFLKKSLQAFTVKNIEILDTI